MANGFRLPPNLPLLQTVSGGARICERLVCAPQQSGSTLGVKILLT
jgi:hypothetical protein